jgi:hypothetical protein
LGCGVAGDVMTLFSFIQTRKGFRILWVMSFVGAIIGVFVDTISPELIQTAALRSHKFSEWTKETDTSFSSLMLTIIFLVIFVFSIKSWIDVFRFKKKGINTSLITFFLSLSFTPFSGDLIFSGFSYAVIVISLIIYGTSITLAKCSPPIIDIFQ